MEGAEKRPVGAPDAPFTLLQVIPRGGLMPQRRSDSVSYTGCGDENDAADKKDGDWDRRRKAEPDAEAETDDYRDGQDTEEHPYVKHRFVSVPAGLW